VVKCENECDIIKQLEAITKGVFSDSMAASLTNHGELFFYVNQ
jgi:hypothetical protein